MELSLFKFQFLFFLLLGIKFLKPNMAFKFLQNLPILALLMALLFAHETLYTAFAASVGRMGGSSFASEKESSSYSSSKSSNIYHYDNNNRRFSSGYVDCFVGIYLSIAYLNRASVLRVQVYHHFFFFVHISLHLCGFFFFGNYSLT